MPLWCSGSTAAFQAAGAGSSPVMGSTGGCQYRRPSLKTVRDAEGTDCARRDWD